MQPKAALITGPDPIKVHEEIGPILMGPSGYQDHVWVQIGCETVYIITATLANSYPSSTKEPFRSDTTVKHPIACFKLKPTPKPPKNTFESITRR